MALWEFGSDRDAAGRALLFADALFNGPRTTGLRQSGPFAWKHHICGVGLFANNATQVVPALFIERAGPLKEMSPQPVLGAPEAVAALTEVFGTNLNWIGNSVAVPVAPTSLHADPGGPVHVAPENGELGAAVTWGGGRGYLTAGHVGQAVNAIADDGSGNNIGTVVYVRTASAIQPLGCAGSSVDVAVVRLYPKVKHGNSLGIVSTAVPPPRGAVHVHTRRGVQNAQIYGAAKWWYVSNGGVTLTEVYLSNAGVTTGGDSGGPVLLANPPGQIIGHIVSGGTATSCFQDVDHQLAEIRKDANFQTIQI